MGLRPDGASSLRSLRSDVRHYDVVHRVHNLLVPTRQVLSQPRALWISGEERRLLFLSEGQRTAERRALIGISQKKVLLLS